MIANLKEQLKKKATTFPKAKVYFREAWECDYFDIEGKFFALYGTNSQGKEVLTIKGEPEANELLREQYDFVVPGYHTNKTHWNSIIIEESTFSLEEYQQLLANSYRLTVAKLPKKVRESLVIQ